MKRIIITSILFFLFIPFVFSQSNFGQSDTLNVINATLQSKLLFNTITQPNNCLPEFRDYNFSGISGYCILDPGHSLFLPNYEALETYYPAIKIYMTGQQNPMSPFSADVLIDPTHLDANWSYFIYKVVGGPVSGGAYIGFSDFYSCHGLPSSHADPMVTGSTFIIGNQRYFTVTQ